MTPSHVLVAEDSPAQAERLRQDLVGAGYDVTVVHDGTEARDLLAEGTVRPDVLVTDVMMPGMDGYELCRWVKRTRDHATPLPVILLSSLRDPVDIVRGLECGADNFVARPYEVDQLLHRLDTVLRSHDLRLTGRFRTGVDVLVQGHTFTVSAERQQILDMLMSSFEELVSTNDRLREREEQLQATQAALEAQIDLARRQRRELEDSRNDLRDILDKARVATWVVDLDDGNFGWSANAFEVLGVDPATPIDDLDGFLSVLVDEDADELRGMVRGLGDGTATVLPDDWEFRVVGDDGQARWFASRGQPLGDGSGSRVTGVTIDITRRRQLEQALLEREQMLSGVLAASPDGIVVSALDGTIRFASDGIRDVVGVAPQQLVGRTPLEFVAPPDRGVVVGVVSSLSDAPHRVQQTRFRVVHASGHTVTVDCRVRLLFSSEGQQDGFVTVVRDVTEQAALEAELERAHDEAQAANEAKSEYLSRMSHELRTPMNSVLGFAQLLERSSLVPDDRDSVDRILTAGRHLLQLIDDVLDIARIEAGRLRVSLEPVRVDEVVTSALELLSPQVRERGLELRVPPHDSPPRVVADRQRLSQVLINLLSNAIKYNRPGGEISVAWHRTAPGWCRIAVTDTGPGIPPDVRPRLFQAFERLGADQTTVPGTGLGLALSKALVDAMAGRIGCDSDGERGSTFWVELPVAASEPIARPDPDDVSEAHPHAGDRPTVLYVEDNPLNVELVARALDGGPELVHAQTGDVGLRLVRERRPDLVLLDLQLPGMSGLEVLAAIRGDAEVSHVPVVVVSADATGTSVEEAEALGADGYLTKPLDLRALHAAIDDHGFRRSPSRLVPDQGGT